MQAEEDELKGVEEQDLALAIDAQIEVGDLPAVEAETPDKLCVLPLQKAIPFPGTMMPVQLASDRARDSVQKAEAEGGYIARDRQLRTSQRESYVRLPDDSL